MEKEIWKNIEGYEGLYQVSNLGRVKSLGNDKSKKEKILKPGLNTNGYPSVILYKEGKSKNIVVHRLVSKAFIPNTNNKPQVNHINGIKTDNKVTNLEWNTRNENMQHAVDTGLLDRKGSKHGMSKLTEEQVLEIRESSLKGVELAKIYGVDPGLISAIKLRKIWKHI